jgi:GxxExxY protein
MISNDGDQEMNAATRLVIGAAIEVHRWLGAGLLEATYENALCRELDLRHASYARQTAVSIAYKGRCVGEHRIDLIVEQRVIVELKSVDRLDPIFDAQMLAYLRCSRLRVGLIINFNSHLLKHGIRRMIL